MCMATHAGNHSSQMLLHDPKSYNKQLHEINSLKVMSCRKKLK